MRLCENYMLKDQVQNMTELIHPDVHQLWFLQQNKKFIYQQVTGQIKAL